MNNEQPPVVTKDAIEIKPMGDVGKIAAEGMPVAEKLERLPKENVEEKEKGINKLKAKIQALFAGGTPEELKIKYLKKGEARLASNPLLVGELKKWEEKGLGEKYKIALGKYQYSMFDEKKQDFVDRGQYIEHVNAA